MGVSSHDDLILSLKGMVKENGGICKSSSDGDGSFLWNKVLEGQARNWRLCQRRKQISKRPRRVLIMKRRRRNLEGYRRVTAGGIKRRVRTLKKLIPNSGESMGMDGLFRDTVDYILSLEMRVRVMQIMVKVLTGSDE